MNSMCVCLCEKCVCVCVGAHALVYLCQWMSGVATGVAVTLRPSVNGWPLRDSTLWCISTFVGLLSIFSTSRVSSLSCLDFWRWETASTPLTPCSQLVPHVIVKVYMIESPTVWLYGTLHASTGKYSVSSFRMYLARDLCHPSLTYRGDFVNRYKIYCQSPFPAKIFLR